MESPEEMDILKLEPPTGHSNRIEFMAKALAFGALNNMWTPSISVNPHYHFEADGTGSFTSELIGEEWNAQGHPLQITLRASQPFAWAIAHALASHDMSIILGQI